MEEKEIAARIKEIENLMPFDIIINGDVLESVRKHRLYLLHLWETADDKLYWSPRIFEEKEKSGYRTSLGKETGRLLYSQEWRGCYCINSISGE